MNVARFLIAASVAPIALIAAAASAQQASNGGTEQGAAQTRSADGQSEDIVVTAQKRVQTLVEVPQSISVVSGETLERQQAKSFLDYAQLVPGLNVVQDNPGQTRLTLRGINTGSVGSTVAIYVDDAPYGASGSLSNGAILAGDFDTFDVARIEVLRGPQGTLYGANALGGVLKFVTAAPVIGKLEGKAQGGVETTIGGGTGYVGNAVINVPLGSMLALRASGFYHKTAGYVDAEGRAGTDIDSSQSYGGRASALFKPTDNLSFRLLGVFQNIRDKSPSSFEADPLSLRPVDPITGISTGDERLRYERFAEFHNVDYRLYSGTIDWDLHLATLTSATSYSTQYLHQISDISTNAVRGLANALYAPTAPNSVGLAYQNDVNVKKLTQELRLVSPKSTVFEYLVGVYYTHEKTDLFQRYLPFTLATQAFIPRTLVFGGQTLQEFVTANIDANYEEIAGFGSGTLHLGPKFDITAGGRYSHNTQDSVQQVNQLGTGAPTAGTSSQGVFTWSVSPRFAINDRAELYARVAKGYRPGGPNFIPANAPAGFPSQFDADTLISYEAGVKAETRNRAFGIDVSAFTIDWNNILITTTVQTAAGPVGINANGKRARSSGFEATATVRPTAGLSVVANFAYTYAYLRDDTVSSGTGLNLTGGLAGDKLPFIPRYQANITGDYEWALTPKVTAFVGGNIRLQGDQPGGFSAAYRAAYGRQISLDGYQTIDLRAGVDIGPITVQAYVKNVGNEYGLVNATAYPFAVPAALGGTGVPLINASTIRPRTVGGTVGFKF